MNRLLGEPHAGPGQGRWLWWAGYVGVFGAALMVVFAFRDRMTYQPYLTLTLGLVGLLLGAWMLRPRMALHGTIFLAMVSDATLLRWFPFSKNLSSRESISFVADALTTSPLELSLAAGFATSVLRTYARSGRPIEPNRLSRPIVVFTLFVVFGLARGFAAGGDLRVSVFEARSLFYILFVFVIVTNECREPRQLRTVFWWVLAGVVVHSLVAIWRLSSTSPQERDELESLGEHGASIPMNLFFMTLFLAVIIHLVPKKYRFLLAAASIPVLGAYLFAQRRAAVAALAIAIVMVLIVLVWMQPRTVRWLAPLIAIVSIGYLGTFWSSESQIGFPAQAVKTAIAADETSQKDQNSNLYRTLENWNVLYTIRSEPIAGQGFGRPFLKPIRLPQITDFVLRDYMPHNSFLWMWIKIGFFGFVATIYMLGRAIVLGVDRARRIGSGVDAVVGLAAVTFVAMYMAYSYLDLLWDARNTVLLGLSFAICAAPIRTSPVDDPPPSGVDVERDDPPTTAGSDRTTRTPPARVGVSADTTI